MCVPGSLGPPCFTYGWEILGPWGFLCGTAQAAGGWDGSLPSHSFPSAPSRSGYSVLGSREHLFGLAKPSPGQSRRPAPIWPPWGKRLVGSRTPTGAQAGPRDVVSTLDFCYLSDLGSLMTVK